MSEKKLKAVPMFNYMFLTCNKRIVSKGGIIMPEQGGGNIEMRQTVLKCGDSVRSIKPGYEVEIDPRPYFVKNWKNQNSPTLDEEIHKQTVGIAWPEEEIDGIEVLVVPDNHIRFYWPLEESGVELSSIVDLSGTQIAK